MPKEMIPYGRQDINEADVAAVVDVLRSDWLTQGPTITRFEEAVAAHCGADFAIAVSNATAALHLACRALGLGPGGRLWTTPNTFVASANCARYCQADIDFVDINPGTFNICPVALAAKLERAERNGQLPDILVPVHFAGQPCDMGAIADLARRYGFAVIEDASHAIGASYQGKPVGSCSYSDITIFSFHPVKILTTGEGGMLLTRRNDLAEKLTLLRSHGITRESAKMLGENHGAWYYEQIELGYNYRMTDIQAALGLSQLSRLDSFLMRRRELADRYDAALMAMPVTPQLQMDNCQSAWHLYPIKVAEGIDRRRVFDRLRALGVAVNVHYIPVHTQPYYQALGFKPGDFPNAEAYYAAAISLPMYAALSDSQQNQVIAALEDALRPDCHD